MADARVRSAGDRYTGVAIALHWTVAALILANLAIGFLHETWLKGTFSVHKAIGITVLVLGVAQLAWRLTHRPPPLLATVKPWERALARTVHWLFYVLIILLPLSGWVFTSASPTPRPLSFLGLFTVPALPVGPDKALSDSVYERHVQFAWIMLALFCLHVAGALKHRFVDRDRTIARVLPGSGPS